MRPIVAEGACLGLTGGLGVGATIHYYQELVAAHQKAQRPLRLLIVHADVDRVLADVRDNKLDELARYLLGLVQQLADGGAQVAAIAAIAPHACAPRLVPLSPLPFVNLVDEGRACHSRERL